MVLMGALTTHFSVAEILLYDGNQNHARTTRVATNPTTIPMEVTSVVERLPEFVSWPSPGASSLSGEGEGVGSFTAIGAPVTMFPGWFKGPRVKLEVVVGFGLTTG